MLRVRDFNVWIADLLETAKIAHELRPYVLRVLTKRDFSGLESKSIVIATAEALSFSDYQDVGDYSLWHGAFTQSSQHGSVIEACGMTAYGRCDQLCWGQSPVFSALARELPTVTRSINMHIDVELTTTLTMFA